MKTCIFAILLTISISNSFAANLWVFHIPGERQYPIQLLNLSTTPGHINNIQLFREPTSGQVYEARITYNLQPDPILERYTLPTPEIQKLDSLDALGWIRFWNDVHQKSPLNLEVVRTLNNLYRVELNIHNLH